MYLLNKQPLCYCTECATVQIDNSDNNSPRLPTALRKSVESTDFSKLVLFGKEVQVNKCFVCNLSETLKPITLGYSLRVNANSWTTFYNIEGSDTLIEHESYTVKECYDFQNSLNSKGYIWFT